MAENPCFQIISIQKWEASLVGIDNQESGLAIFEFKSPLYFVGYGFKFAGISTNEEYIERESEFDSKEELFEVEIKNIDMTCRDWSKFVQELRKNSDRTDKLKKYHTRRLLSIQFD